VTKEQFQEWKKDLDSLAHINYDGVFYNGYKPDKEGTTA
jgi:hypothetical protein